MGVGVPVAAAVNVAAPPAHTVVGEGWVVIVGGDVTVRMAALVVADPHVLVKIALY